MCEVEKNVQFTWQLVSQFVSWEFCRYTCQQFDNANYDPDVEVLTFLRNMIVDRTEKSITDVTKHEIIAQFVMESKAIQTISRFPCISALSETVKKICPELEQAVNALVQQLLSLLNILDWNDDTQNHRLILMKRDTAVNEFSKEANRILPPPDLLKVVQPWFYFRHPDQKSHQSTKKKPVYNPDTFEKVLECMHKQKLTSTEAKIIAVALYEDKKLERIILDCESETETVADSDMFSQSLQFTNPGFSGELSQAADTEKQQEEIQRMKYPLSNSLDLNSQLFVTSQQREVIPQEKNSNLFIAKLTSSGTSESEDLVPSLHSVSSACVNNITNGENQPDDCMQFAQSSDKGTSESEDLEMSLSSRIRKKNITVNTKQRRSLLLKQICNDSSDLDASDSDNDIRNKQSTTNTRRTSLLQNHAADATSDTDTSDCDKALDIHFLTPTLFKEGAAQKRRTGNLVWLSDSDSNQSSIVTPLNSQHRDPTWKSASPRESDASSLPRSAKKRRVYKPSIKPLRKCEANEGQSSENDDYIPNNKVPSVGSAKKKATASKATSKTKPPRKKAPTKKQPKTMRCKYCDKIYKVELALRRHLFMIHNITIENDNLSDAISFVD